MKYVVLSIIYEGSELPVDVRRSLAEIIASSGYVTDVSSMVVMQHTDEEIAALCAQINNHKAIPETEPQFTSAEDHSIYYIGKKFELSIKKAPMDFFFNVLDHIRQNGKECNTAKAIYVIANNATKCVNSHVLKDMHMTEIHIQLIKRIYNEVF